MHVYICNTLLLGKFCHFVFLLCVVCSTNRMCNTSMMSWVCFLGILGSGCPGVDLSHLGDNQQNTLCTAVNIAESCLEFTGKICLLKSPKLMQIGLFRIYHSASSYTGKQWHRSCLLTVILSVREMLQRVRMSTRYAVWLCGLSAIVE